MGLILHDFGDEGKRLSRQQWRQEWRDFANWLIVVGCAVGAAYVFAGAAGWL